jgi:hypothetical protein
MNAALHLAADQWARQLKADPLLHDTVRGEPDRVFDAFAFEILINVVIGEAGVGANYIHDINDHIIAEPSSETEQDALPFFSKR